MNSTDNLTTQAILDEAKRIVSEVADSAYWRGEVVGGAEWTVVHFAKKLVEAYNAEVAKRDI
jgi:hypothetical protein